MMKYFMLPVACGLFAFNSMAQTLVEFANAGDKALSESNYTEAVDNYLKALELDTDKIDYTTAYNLGLAYEGMSDNKSAMDAFKNSILMGNDERAAYNKMKSNSDAMKCNECLETAYLEILEKKPENSLYINERLFYVYTAKKDNDAALEAGKKVLCENPENFAIVKNVGLIYSSTNKSYSAVHYLEKTMTLQDSDPTVNKTLGLIYFKTCEAKVKAETQKYEKGKKDSSAYNSMMYNRQSHEKSYYPKAIKLLSSANATLNDPEITKLISKMNSVMSAYNK